MGQEDRPKQGEKTAKAKISAAALAIAALLSQSSAPASTSVHNLIEQAKQQVVAAAPSAVRPAPPPLVLKPSNAPNELRGGHRSHSSHSSHRSHSSHSSHYSGTGGIGGGGGITPPSRTPPPPSPPPYQPPVRNDPPPPSQPPARKEPPAQSPPAKPPVQAEETIYPFIVTLKDRRVIECDVQTDGDHMLLVKKGGSIRVLKTDVDRIDKNLRYRPPSTRPSTPAR
jgi:hypothetical protein